MLSQETREVNIEALPGDIPDSIDARRLRRCRSTTRSRCRRSPRPTGITLLDDLDETVIATITPPTLEPVDDEIETETGLVGEDGEAEGRPRAKPPRRPPSSAESSDES